MDKQKTLENFGLNLKLFRLKLKLSQDDIANMTGLSKPYISNVERAKHDISMVNALKLAKAVGKKIEDLISD